MADDVTARRRERIVQLAEDLPGVVVAAGGERHLGFTVRGKRFAWYVDDHHGDGAVALHLKAAAGVSGSLVRDGPDRYFVPPYVGARGWVGLRVDGAHLDWDELDERLVDAYLLVAPKRLAAQVRSGRGTSGLT